MTETVSITLPADTWVEVADSPSRLLLQQQLVGAIRVHVGAEAPASNAAAFALTRDLQLDDISGKVFCRAIERANAVTALRWSAE